MIDLLKNTQVAFGDSNLSYNSNMFNPLTHKQPYGASVANKATTIQFPLPCSMGIKRVFVVLRKIFEIESSDSFRFELTHRGAYNGEDIFEGSFALNESGIYKYRFEGEYEDKSLAFFGRDYNGNAIKGDWLPEWQLTVTNCEHKVPNWATEGVTYHIFADRFCKGEDRPFVKKGKIHSNWYDKPDIADEGMIYYANDFFGGNIAGIISKLDYIKSLGVSCIYLSPIFKSSSNHRYDTGDYLEIDELFGDEEQFATLIKETKARGMHIMLDGVFNHTGADSIYFNKFDNYDSIGACQSKDSQYYDWYYFGNYPHTYHCWWGSTVVPTVNKGAKGFRELILGENGVIDKWTNMGVDGWRLDVVDELPVDFTTDLCKCIKSKSDDTFVVGEVWEDASVKVAYDKWRPYFMGEQLDSVMNYPFKNAIHTYVMTGRKQAFIGEVSKILEHYPKGNLESLMNLIDSHDTVRAITALSGVNPQPTKRERANFTLNNEQYSIARKRLMLASILQFTLPGVPCLFYGDEVGVQGFEDPMSRGTYPWGIEDTTLLEHYRRLGKMRVQYKNMLKGEMSFVEDDNLLIYKIKSVVGEIWVYANATSSDKYLGESVQDIVTNEDTNVVKSGCAIVVRK